MIKITLEIINNIDLLEGKRTALRMKRKRKTKFALTVKIKRLFGGSIRA